MALIALLNGESEPSVIWLLCFMAQLTCDVCLCMSSMTDCFAVPDGREFTRRRMAACAIAHDALGCPADLPSQLGHEVGIMNGISSAINA